MSLPPDDVLAQMARDAIAYHDDGLCPYLEHAIQVEQYREALDHFEPVPALAAALPPSDPG